MTDQPHARAFDLPGWPCPPRVRDIEKHYNSWGLVPMGGSPSTMAVAQDELGYLWANGDIIPRFELPNEANQNPGAILFWTEQGIGVHIHPRSMRFLGDVSQLDMEPGQWVRIAEAAAELPEFVTEASVMGR